MKIFIILYLLALLMVQEGACTHLETCECHEIKDLVNATVQQAAANLESKISIMINTAISNINTTDEPSLSKLEKKLTSTMERLLRPIQAQLDYHLPKSTPPAPDTKKNPATSCKDLHDKYPTAPSDYYWISTSGSPVRVYCNMDMTCGNQEGGWMKVADIDMTNTSQQCPSGLTLISSPKQSCDITTNGCASNSFTVHGIVYSHVCGRIIAYQRTTPVAFYYGSRGIDGAYVFGVSLTYGQSPRKHIWTFAGAYAETISNPRYICPCTNTNVNPPPTTPSYIGNDYFCDTAHYNSAQNPLWDGEGCGPTNMCCSFPGSGITPPWFVKALPSSTTDNIEMRLCRPDSSGSTPIEIVELYVQ